MEQPATPSAPTQAAPSGLPEGYTLENGNAPSSSGSDTGEVTNDVGNTVIVPKDGESFADTMKRAVEQGKKNSPDAIKKELATAPGKVATVLGAAPVIGAAAPATVAAIPDVAEFAIKKLAGDVLPGMEGQAAREVLRQAVPKAISFAKDMAGSGLTLAGTYELLKHLMGDAKK